MLFLYILLFQVDQFKNSTMKKGSQIQWWLSASSLSLCCSIDIAVQSIGHCWNQGEHQGASGVKTAKAGVSGRGGAGGLLCQKLSSKSWHAGSQDDSKSPIEQAGVLLKRKFPFSTDPVQIPVQIQHRMQQYPFSTASPFLDRIGIQVLTKR